MGVRTLYLRFFDVDFNEEFPEPIGELNSLQNQNQLNSFDKIIPTVFITNRTLIKINGDKIDSLAALISLKLTKNTEGAIFKNKIQEMLIDCDWTEKTRDKYFYLIKQLKIVTNKKIISTIRLHQIKFKEKTGVPPADKGVLMAYNTGDLNDPQTINSILDVSVLNAYITHLDQYPLILDLALPIFSWAIVQRDGQSVQLIPNFSKAVLSENKEKKDTYTEGVYFETNTTNKITILKSGYYNGIYLYADDVIKIEEVPFSDLQAAAESLSLHIRNKNFTLSFFSLDSTNLKRYDVVDLAKIGRVFSH
ncbi:MAG: hypothetical protein U5L45_11070 [Saprospiraceae bacterium]|nr:hypothetical protein [Saprospiraceae bacterium]